MHAGIVELFTIWYRRTYPSRYLRWASLNALTSSDPHVKQSSRIGDLLCTNCLCTIEIVCAIVQCHLFTDLHVMSSRSVEDIQMICLKQYFWHLLRGVVRVVVAAMVSRLKLTVQLYTMHFCRRKEIGIRGCT